MKIHLLRVCPRTENQYSPDLSSRWQARAEAEKSIQHRRVIIRTKLPFRLTLPYPGAGHETNQLQNSFPELSGALRLSGLRRSHSYITRSQITGCAAILTGVKKEEKEFKIRSQLRLTSMEPQPSLPKLLAALALGARSVNSLPFSSSANGGGDSDDEVEDDFEYSMSLPEFAALNHEARQLMTSLLRETLEIISPTTNNYDDLEFDDPALWESCADACDELRDRVMSYLPNANAGQRPDIMNLASKVDSAKQTALSKAAGSYSRMVNSLADMEKPQHIFQGFVTHPPQNTRGEPFVPIIFDAAKQARLDAGEYNVSGHGLETRHNDGRNESGERDATKRKYASDMIAPTYHIDHPYRDEIETLEYRPWQLSTDGIQKDVLPSLKANDDQGVWIGTEAELALLCKKITEEDIQEIALDLEAHSHRSFAGFICLIQLSIRRPETGGDKGEQYDYLIDALSLRHVISSYIGPILANPNILKVGLKSVYPTARSSHCSFTTSTHVL